MNMVYLNPWINFVSKHILTKEELDRDYEDLRHVIIYTMCYMLTKMIRSMLAMYLKHCNVEESRISILDKMLRINSFNCRENLNSKSAA